MVEGEQTIDEFCDWHSKAIHDMFFYETRGTRLMHGNAGKHIRKSSIFTYLLSISSLISTFLQSHELDYSHLPCCNPPALLEREDFVTYRSVIQCRKCLPREDVTPFEIIIKDQVAPNANMIFK